MLRESVCVSVCDGGNPKTSGESHGDAKLRSVVGRWFLPNPNQPLKHSIGFYRVGSIADRNVRDGRLAATYSKHGVILD